MFAGYEIERELGRGGMGSVYLARHPRLPRLIALKLLNREVVGDTEVRRRFEREADVVAQLDHPNIVPVYDRGLDDGQLWIAMRYIDGVDASGLEAANLPPRQAIRIVAETARALDFAHRRGVLHRDVKPANILLERVDAEERVFLADFGIARLRDDATKLTQTGSFTATLTYASPEQLSGQPLGPQTDQYSLACTLFRLLTGNVPFTAEHPVGIIHGHLSQTPPPVSSLRPGLPSALDAVLARALAKQPQARFDNCVDFTTAAMQALENPAGATQVLGQLNYGAPRPYAQPVPTAQLSAPLRGVDPNSAPGQQYSEPGQYHPGTARYPSDPYAAVPAQAEPTRARTRQRAVAPPKKKRSKLRGCLWGAVVIVVLPVLAVGGCLAYLDRNQSSGTVATTTEAPVTTTEDAEPTTAEPTPTEAAVPDHAGQDAQVISKRFPAMLPTADPTADANSGAGYQGIACTTYGRTTPPPDTGAGDPDFGNWALSWDCPAGAGRASYRILMYRTPTGAGDAASALPANTHTDLTVNGSSYTNYALSGSTLLRPRLVTEFHAPDGDYSFLMYSTGFLITDDQLLTWFKSAPVH
ncbi:protein kinase domain-containing protein [Nocardia sp. NBC_00511]|uniref:serine/threonine-protein kinase n=1 Tax=Nocardia sp. NBC_00511 TaxID=2903591 RepID=UPI0030E3B0D8